MHTHVTRFQLGFVTKQLVDHLLTASVGQEMSYEELSKVLGHNILQQKYRSCLASARRILIKEHDIVFDTIRSVGIQRLNDAEIVLEGAVGIRKVRRACKRTARKVVCANYSTLSQDNKNTHNQSLSTLGALMHVTSIKEQRKVGHAVSKVADEIDHTALFAICK